MTIPLPTPLEVKLDLFRGPLHTLLDLIERRELPVTAVSLVAVADQYLALVRSGPLPDLDATAEFLHVAARLILLKSQALLPRPDGDGPDVAADDGDDLEARLVVYRRYRNAALALRDHTEQRGRMFGRMAAADVQLPAPAGVDADPRRLQRAALRALARAAAAERARSAAPGPLVPFTDVLKVVVDRLRLRREASFHELATEAADVITAITMFLAVLELVHKRRVLMRQRGTFGPIELVTEWEVADGAG